MANKPDITKTYTWNVPSLLKRIDVREQSNGEAVAYLHTAENETRVEALQQLREAFGSQGWTASSDSHLGEPVLRLTGLKDAAQLISFIETYQKNQPEPYIQGDACVMQDTPEKKQPKGLLDTLAMHSSRGSGIFYTLGNAFYILSGISRNRASGRNDWGQIGTGVAFSSGDLLLAITGGKDDNHQFKSLLRKLCNHWEKHGIVVPVNSAISAETTPRRNATFGERAYDFLHENINTIKALAEVLGGAMYFRAGREQKNAWKQATAVIFTIGFGSTLFIEEKKTDPEKLKDAGFLKKAWAFVQEKPLRVAGWSGLSNTLFTTIGALKERALKDGTHHYKYDLAAASSMLVGNNLYALSSKSTGGRITTHALVEDVYGLAAQVITRLPPEKREEAIKATVDFLGARTEIKDTHTEVDISLREEITRLQHENPWFKPPSAMQAAPAPERQWSTDKKPVEEWKASVDRPADLSPQPAR